MKERMTLRSLRDRWQPTDSWDISYHDRSHVPTKDGQPEFVKIAKLDMGKYPGGALRDNEIVPFWLRIYALSAIADNYRSVWRSALEKRVGVDDSEHYAQAVHEELRDVLVRTGLWPLVISQDDWIQLVKHRGGLVLVTDTSAIRKGVVSHIARVLRDASIWVIVPVVSLFELQDAASRATIGPEHKPIYDGRRIAKKLRSRPMSTSSTRELLVMRERLPVEFLEVPIELLSRVRGDKPVGERQVLPDRLLLEEIKRLKRSRGLGDSFFLVSTDWDMVRFARLERLGAVYVRRPVLNASGDRIYSVRFDLRRRDFVVATVHELVWDLAHVFERVRVARTDGKESIDVAYAFGGKSIRDWEDDVLEVQLGA